MTDIAEWIALLTKSGIPFERNNAPEGRKDTHTLVIRAGCSGDPNGTVQGYSGFLTEIQFQAETGKFVCFGIWE